jgi:hypothetical protein
MRALRQHAEVLDCTRFDFRHSRTVLVTSGTGKR